MTPLVLWIVTLVIAYLIGSIPTGYLLVRMFQKQDVRETGSGNIGAYQRRSRRRNRAWCARRWYSTC